MDHFKQLIPGELYWLCPSPSYGTTITVWDVVLLKCKLRLKSALVSIDTAHPVVYLKTDIVDNQELMHFLYSNDGEPLEAGLEKHYFRQVKSEKYCR